MKNFTDIEGYTGHSFVKTNFNLKNDGKMVQLFINGCIVNRCILMTKDNIPYIKYKKEKYKINY